MKRQKHIGISKSRYTLFRQCPKALKIKDMLPEKQQSARLSLLKYCELDTYAMVKVWQKLKEVSR